MGQHSIRPAGQERAGCEIPGTKNSLFQFNQEGKGHGKWGVHLMYNDAPPLANEEWGPPYDQGHLSWTQTRQKAASQKKPNSYESLLP